MWDFVNDEGVKLFLKCIFALLDFVKPNFKVSSQAKDF